MNLEDIYEIMNEKNKHNIIYDSELLVQESYKNNYCYAVYSLGNWYLEHSFIRLNEYIRTFISEEYGITYNPHPRNNGLLHQTLLQFISFSKAQNYKEDYILKSLDVIKRILEQNKKYVKVQYRGLVFTKTGLALRGYSDQYQYILEIRKKIEITLKEQGLPVDIPYFNDIVHSTFLRWVKQPTEEMLERLKKEIIRFDECVFGEIRIHTWHIGKATWKMLDHERHDIYQVYMPNIILHRGLNNDSYIENHPDTLEQRTKEGFAVECDIWFQNSKWYLGHDKPEYIIDIESFLKVKNRLIHAKDGFTFAILLKYCNERGYKNEIFYHTNDNYVLTTLNNIIAYPGKDIYENTICMMPEDMKRPFIDYELKNRIAICSDNYILFSE